MDRLSCSLKIIIFYINFISQIVIILVFVQIKLSAIILVFVFNTKIALQIAKIVSIFGNHYFRNGWRYRLDYNKTSIVNGT